MVPAQATGVALIIVGWLMVSTLVEFEGDAEGKRRMSIGIDFTDVAVGFSAALAILVMPFTYSITNGIGFGFIAYVIIRAAQGRIREVHPLMLVTAAGFVLYFLIPLLQENFSWI